MVLHVQIRFNLINNNILPLTNVLFLDVKMNDVVFSKRLKVLITSDTTRTHFVTLDIERSKEVRSDVYNLRLTGNFSKCLARYSM